MSCKRLAAVLLSLTLALLNIHYLRHAENNHALANNFGQHADLGTVDSRTLRLGAAVHSTKSVRPAPGDCELRAAPLFEKLSINSSSWSTPGCSCGRVGQIIYCPPTFIIVGANKAGTSSLYHYLSIHPRVLPAAKKELHFWTFRFSTSRRSIEHYLGNLSSAAAHHERNLRFLNGRSSSNDELDLAELITGEATPDIHYYPFALFRLKTLLPSVKLILLRRDALDLAFSVFNYNQGKFRSLRNVPRFRSLEGAARAFGMKGPLRLIERIRAAGNSRQHAEALLRALTFKDWIGLFECEISVCMNCLLANHTASQLESCASVPQLMASKPALFRWQEDVDVGDFTESLSSLEQCWYLNFLFFVFVYLISVEFLCLMFGMQVPPGNTSP